jgi:hypothetical protein
VPSLAAEIQHDEKQQTTWHGGLDPYDGDAGLGKGNAHT